MSDSLTSLEKRLLERIQQEFPLCPDPYGELAEGTGCTREEAHRAVLKLRGVRCYTANRRLICSYPAGICQCTCRCAC